MVNRTNLATNRWHDEIALPILAFSRSKPSNTQGENDRCMYHRSNPPLTCRLSPHKAIKHTGRTRCIHHRTNPQLANVSSFRPGFVQPTGSCLLHVVMLFFAILGVVRCASRGGATRLAGCLSGSHADRQAGAREHEPHWKKKRERIKQRQASPRRPLLRLTSCATPHTSHLIDAIVLEKLYQGHGQVLWLHEPYNLIGQRGRGKEEQD